MAKSKSDVSKADMIRDAMRQMPNGEVCLPTGERGGRAGRIGER